MNLAQIDDMEARIHAFLYVACVHGGIVYRERTASYAWDVSDRATRLWCLKSPHNVTAVLWLEAAHERRKAAT